MATQLTVEPVAEDAQYQAMTQHYLAEIQQINQAMARDQQEIERLQADTRHLLTNMQTILQRIEARWLMWSQIADFAKQLFMQSQETQKNKGDIKELQREVKELSATVQRLIYEVHRMGENEQHEREKMALRLEVQLLRSGHQLPMNPPRQDIEEN